MQFDDLLRCTYSLDKNHLFLDNAKNLANNEKEEENDSHIHSISSTRNMGNWSNLLGIHDLPSIDPLQEANIILSLNVSNVSKKSSLHFT